MRIIRVFPCRTSYTPNDEYCFFDVPGLFIPLHDEVHIVTVFTWDIPKALELQKDWQAFTDKPVKIGGPAFDDPCQGEFVPGQYVAQGVTFTSRGCNNNCPWCFVPKREGKLREIKIHPGNIIQDNNFLQCSKEHRRKAYDMLKTQRQICFKGGLETSLLTDWDIEEMRGLRIKELWLACDTKNSIKNLKKACERLQGAGFSQNKIRCYTLIGDDITENENRVISVYEAGALPFAQLFQPIEGKVYPKEWRQFQRLWQRPAAMRSFMKKRVS